MSSTQPSQPISSLGGEPSSWPTRTAAYEPFDVAFDAGTLLNRTFSIWRDDLKRLAGISVLPYLMMCVGMFVAFFGLMSSIGVSDLFNIEEHFVLLASVGSGTVAFCALLYIAAQVGTYVAVEEIVRGEPRRVGVVSSLIAGLSAMPAVIGVYLAGGIVCGVVMAPMLTMFGVAAFNESWAFGGFGALLAVPTMLAVFVFSLRVMAIAPVVAVIEEVGAIDAMRRSIELTRGRAVDFFVAALVMGAVLLGLQFVIGIVGMVPLLGVLVQLVAGVLMGSLSSVWLFLAYAGLRDQHGK